MSMYYEQVKAICDRGDLSHKTALDLAKKIDRYEICLKSINNRPDNMGNHLRARDTLNR